jgi:hypothetical protein
LFKIKQFNTTQTMNLIDLITGNTGNQVAAEAEKKFGISQNQVIALLAVAAPLVISYLKNKSQDANAAEALNKALDRDHDGSILDNPAHAAERQQEGGSILDHIFGEQKATVENQLSQNTGISMEKIGPILAILAPIIMGYIGKEKQASGVTSGGLGDLLGGILGGAQNQAQAQPSNPLNDILGSVLGSGNQQGENPLNDILGQVLGGGSGQQQPQQGGLGGLLGSILGGGR